LPDALGLFAVLSGGNNELLTASGIGATTSLGTDACFSSELILFKVDLSCVGKAVAQAVRLIATQGIIVLSFIF
jgi:hypothetical protein